MTRRHRQNFVQVVADVADTWQREKVFAVIQYMKTPLGMPLIITAGTIITCRKAERHEIGTQNETEIID